MDLALISSVAFNANILSADKVLSIIDRILDFQKKAAEVIKGYLFVFSHLFVNAYYHPYISIHRLRKSLDIWYVSQIHPNSRSEKHKTQIHVNLRALSRLLSSSVSFEINIIDIWIE